MNHSKNYDDFARILYQALIMSGDIRLGDVLVELNLSLPQPISEQALRSYIKTADRGGNICPPAVIREIYRITGDDRLIEYFIPQGKAIVSLPSAKDDGPRGIVGEIAAILVRAGEVASHAARSISERSSGGAAVTRSEAKAIKRKARVLEQEVERLIKMIENGGDR